MSTFFQTVLPGLLLIALAFVAGSHKNPGLGLVGFLCFFVAGVTFLVEGLRKKWDAAQTQVYAAARNQRLAMENDYRFHLKRAGRTLQPKGLFSARLLGQNFAVSAMALALGEPARARTEAVYAALLKEASAGVELNQDEMRKMAGALLREQTRLLAAEFRNVGSGQYGLAALYESALQESAGSAESTAWGEPIESLLGRTLGERLAEWAALYKEIAGRPMQTYAAGFVKSGKDLKPFES